MINSSHAKIRINDSYYNVNNFMFFGDRVVMVIYNIEQSGQAILIELDEISKLEFVSAVDGKGLTDFDKGDTIASTLT